MFCMNMKGFSTYQISKWSSEPDILNVSWGIILENKVIFLLDSDRNIEPNFSYVNHNRNNCFLNCLEPFLDGENHWINLIL